MFDTKNAVVWMDTAEDDEAWAVVHHKGGTKRILHTADAGDSWAPLPDAPVWGPSFATAQFGVATRAKRAYYGSGTVLPSKRLMQTADGGQSWQPMASPCKPADAGAAVAAGSPTDVWVVCVGEQSMSLEPKVLYYSATHGSDWQHVTGSRRSCDGGVPCLGYTYQLAFTDQSGLLTTQFPELSLTVDGGQQWTQALVSGPHASRMLSAQPLGPEDVVALAEGSGATELKASADAAQTWTTVHRWRWRRN